MEGKAALIGYENKAGDIIINYQIMKNGMIELALDSGKVEFIDADYVRENDVFILKKSVNGDDYDFQPALKDRGNAIGFYAAMKLKSGSTHVKWMTIQEVQEHRDNYSSMYRVKPDASPWKHSFNSMGIKTVLKSLLRSVQVSKTLDDILTRDDSIDADFTIDMPTMAEETTEKLKAKSDKKPVEPEANQGDLL